MSGTSGTSSTSTTRSWDQSILVASDQTHGTAIPLNFRPPLTHRVCVTSGSGGRCCIGAGQTLCEHFPTGSPFLCKMTSWPPSPKCDVKLKIRLPQSMRIYVKNIRVKFHPDPIGNDGVLGFSKSSHQQEEQEKQQQQEDE